MAQKYLISCAYHPFITFLKEIYPKPNTSAVNVSKGLLYQEWAFSFKIIKFYERKLNLMDLMNLKLQKTLQEKRSDFIDSLQLSGVDIEHGSTISGKELE